MEAKASLGRWFAQQAIVSPNGETWKPHGLFALASSTVRDIRDLPRPLPRALLHSALTGATLPPDVLAAAIRRVRAAQDRTPQDAKFTHPRAALIKLCLARQLNWRDHVMESLEPGEPRPAYQCGRLLTVLEEAQREAIPKSVGNAGGPLLRLGIVCAGERLRNASPRGPAASGQTRTRSTRRLPRDRAPAGGSARCDLARRISEPLSRCRTRVSSLSATTTSGPTTEPRCIAAPMRAARVAKNQRLKRQSRPRHRYTATFEGDRKMTTPVQPATPAGAHLDVSRRHDFVLLFDVADGNPNGDPDAGNLPRVDPETMQGLVTDVAIKRKVRDFVAAVQGDVAAPESSRFKIYVESDGRALNAQHRRAYESLDIKSTGSKQKREDIDRVRPWMCQNFYDIRVFGAVMTTEVNCGQVRGPIQLRSPARSIRLRLSIFPLLG